MKKFAKTLLGNPGLLFAGIPLTKERIEFYYNQLINLFNMCTVDDNNKCVFERVIKCCLTTKEQLLNELEKRVNNLRYLDYCRYEGDKLMRGAEESKIKKVQLALALYEQSRAAVRTLDKNGRISEIVDLRKCMAKSLILADEFKCSLSAQSSAISILLKTNEESSSSVGIKALEDLVKLLKSLQEKSNGRILDDPIEMMEKDNNKLRNYFDCRIRNLILAQYLSSAVKGEQNLDKSKTVEKYPTIASFKHLEIPTMSYAFEIGINAQLLNMDGMFPSLIIERMLNDPFLSSYARTHFPNAIDKLEKVPSRSYAWRTHQPLHLITPDIIAIHSGQLSGH
ncbi:unnamed protein product [Didymodactylos carnosus]|uniref:Uncharacterized protein n=1 Tax=Didymodactylos carnosus TaxID=1234261 RepID=A0A816CWA1_9BILA|nr:unnamed protein product [Didymodactylos carnosus]CAF1629025.1 unnamed protein product [Didymodactylos carnosus]CAF4308821.1 unnamed protein product [Didymodactylos carnosus]CAF4526151.1 unnamed protein product [Didymodactylos carnosus]